MARSLKRRAHLLAERGGLAAARLGFAPPPLPLPLYDAYFGAMASRALVAACSTGLADALPGTPDELAERLELDPLGVDVVLRALESLGYVRARRGCYRLTRPGGWLRRERLGEMVGDFVPDAWETLGHLEPALRGGAPGGLHERPPDDPFWRHYQRAMIGMAGFTADAFAAAVPAHAPLRALDLAGGPGTYAIALCRRHPDLRATVVELPGAVPIGREHVAAAGLADRIDYLEGDLFELDLPLADLVTANGVLHTMSREQAVALLRRARGALTPGGVFASFNLEAPERGERTVQFAALLSLVFYASAHARAFTAAELEGMLTEASFTGVRLLRPLRLPGGVVAIGAR